MKSLVRWGSTQPIPENLEQFQLGYHTTENTLYIKNEKNEIIHLTKGWPVGKKFHSEIHTGPSQPFPRKFYEMVKISNVSQFENISLKFNVTYYHKTGETDFNSTLITKTETAIGQAFIVVDHKDRKQSTNMYGAITNLINNDLHLAVNLFNSDLSIYFVADKCVEGYCRIDGVEVYHDNNFEINYLMPEILEFKTELATTNLDLYPFRIKPVNG